MKKHTNRQVVTARIIGTTIVLCCASAVAICYTTLTHNCATRTYTENCPRACGAGTCGKALIATSTPTGTWTGLGFASQGLDTPAASTAPPTECKYRFTVSCAIHNQPPCSPLALPYNQTIEDTTTIYSTIATGVACPAGGG